MVSKLVSGSWRPLGSLFAHSYPSDVSDEEWAVAMPYVTLLSPAALQRKHDLRAVFNAVRSLAHTGAPWRYLPSDFPPWPVVYQQLRRWLAAGSFEALVHDTRLLLRTLKGRASQPSAVIVDARVLPSTPASGDRAGSSGHKRRKGAKIHAAVDTLGDPLALSVTPASEEERTQVEALTAQVQAVTGDHVEFAYVEIAYVDQGYTGPDPLANAAQRGIELVVIKAPEAKRGFVLLPKRWVVERSFAWMSRARRLARDCERLPQVLIGLHFLAFACLMLHQLIHLFSSS